MSYYVCTRVCERSTYASPRFYVRWVHGLTSFVLITQVLLFLPPFLVKPYTPTIHDRLSSVSVFATSPNYIAWPDVILKDREVIIPALMK